MKKVFQPDPDSLVEVATPRIRRRTDVVGIFPDRGSIVRLVGAVLAEQHDEWADGRRYLGLEILGRSRLVLVTDTQEKEDPTDTVGAISA